MTIERKSRTSGTFGLSDARVNTIDSLRTPIIDTPEAEEHIRRTIMQMGFIDRIVDRLFHASAKHNSLIAIAELFIANTKLAAKNLPIEAAEELKQKRDDAGRMLLRYAHAEGHNSLMASCEPTDEGGRLSLRTKHEWLDGLLTFTVAHDEIARFIQTTKGSVDAALAYRSWAENAKTHAMKADLYACEARAWETSDNHNDAMTAWMKCAIVCEAHEAKLSMTVQRRTTISGTASYLSAASYRARASAASGAAMAWAAAEASAKRSLLLANADDCTARAERSGRAAKTYSDIAITLDADVTGAVEIADRHRAEARAFMEISDYARAQSAWERYQDACAMQAHRFLAPMTHARARVASQSIDLAASAYESAAAVSRVCADDLGEAARNAAADGNTKAAAVLHEMAQAETSKVHRLVAQLRTETGEYDLALDNWKQYAETCLGCVSAHLQNVSRISTDDASERYRKAAKITQGAAKFLEAAADQAARAGRTLHASQLRDMAAAQRRESAQHRALSDRGRPGDRNAGKFI